MSETEPKMKYESLLKSPKKEEQEVPDSIHVLDELEGILGIEDEEKFSKDNTVYGLLSWDSMDWEEPPNGENEDGEYNCKFEDGISSSCFFEEDSHFYGSNTKVMKRERSTTSTGFLGEFEDKRMSLNLNLNYQEVLDAWSDRGSLRANDCSLSAPTNGYYIGEVPVMEEERTRREASVLRYKEKRQIRLFSKKIRYQVRKLNADKRPRLKGRFVKGGS